MTAFEKNESIYLETSGEYKIIIQDLESFENTEIVVEDTLLNERMTFPQIMRFGNNENDVFILDSDNSIWKIDLITKNVNKFHNGFSIESGSYSSNLFSLDSPNLFLATTNSIAINDNTADQFLILELPNPDSTHTISNKGHTSKFWSCTTSNRQEQILLPTDAWRR